MIKKKKYNIIVIISLLLASIVISLTIGACLVGFVKKTREIFLDNNTYLIAFVLIALEGIAVLTIIVKKSKRNYMPPKGDEGVESNLENARFLKDNERDEIFKKVSFKELGEVENAGIPVRAEYINGELEINLTKPAHTLILGTTGSGKTSTFISPSIEILSSFKEKPSLFISDPKGELFRTHAGALKKKGYKIKVIDLRNPYSSVRWNPMLRAWDMKQEILHLKDKIVIDEEIGRYYLNGVAYVSKDVLNEQIAAIKQKMEDEIYETLHDIVSAITPKAPASSDPIWYNGAQNMILAIALAMLEDSENEECDITREKYNFYNLYKIATSTENNCKELKNYFNGRSITSKAVTLSTQVLGAPDKMMGSFTSTMQNCLSMFSDLSLCALTSQDEADFMSMADEPTAFFIQIPDEKETRHPLASLMILQAYKDLVQRANRESNLSLPRDVFFLLDEFGNLPRIIKLEQMITVGRSRRIWFNLVVQSYSQIENVYDKTTADILKSNCNIHIFIGTTDLITTEEFSRKCGRYSVISRHVNKKEIGGVDSVADTITERPLIYPSELMQLNKEGDMGHAIVTVFGFQPLNSFYTPIYKCPLYTLGNARLKNHEMHPFVEEKILYIWQKAARNREISKSTTRVRGVRKLCAEQNAQPRMSREELLKSFS